MEMKRWNNTALQSIRSKRIITNQPQLVLHQVKVRTRPRHITTKVLRGKLMVTTSAQQTTKCCATFFDKTSGPETRRPNAQQARGECEPIIKDSSGADVRAEETYGYGLFDTLED